MKTMEVLLIEIACEYAISEQQKWYRTQPTDIQVVSAKKLKRRSRKMQSIEKVQELARSAALLELWAHAWSLGPEEASEFVKSTIEILKKEEAL